MAKDELMIGFKNFLIKEKKLTTKEADALIKEYKRKKKIEYKSYEVEKNKVQHYNLLDRYFGSKFKPEYTRKDVAKKGKVLVTDISYLSGIKKPKIVALGQIKKYEDGMTKVYYCE